MVKKMLGLLLVAGLLAVWTSSCSLSQPEDAVKDQAVDAQLDKEVGAIFTAANEAMVTNDSQVIENFKAKLAEFDKKYGSSVTVEIESNMSANQSAVSRLNSGTSFPAMTDLPFNKDGAVYISGGTSDVIGTVLTALIPAATSGKYYHGAILDLDKFDPTSLSKSCLQTAVTKGAGYESAYDWMTKQSVAAFNPSMTLNAAALNSAQANMDYYCDPNNNNEQYGFFKDYANIFSVVTKADNFYWYCTKVVWRVYNMIGYDIDSNSPKLDYTKSGLYSIVKAYYYSVYWYNWSKAEQKIQEYINSTRANLVLAEEIYYSPLMTRVYERIR